MRIVVQDQHRSVRHRAHLQRAFSIIEILVGVLIIGIMAVGLYIGMTQGFGVIRLARENLRATQILQEKMETIRLYTWDQVNAPGFIPETFNEPFYAVGEDRDDGLVYQGRVTITNANMPLATYGNDLREVRVAITWNSGNVQRQREMRTLISRYGLHKYIY